MHHFLSARLTEKLEWGILIGHFNQGFGATLESGKMTVLHPMKKSDHGCAHNRGPYEHRTQDRPH